VEKHKRINIKRIAVLNTLLLFIFFGCYHTSQAQTVGPETLSSGFVKKRVLQKTGEMSFNILRIYNYSDSSIFVKPVLNIPDKFAVFSTSFIDKVIAPGDTVSLPFSIRIPSEANAIIDHNIIFQGFSKQNKLIVEDTFFIQAQPFHKWDIAIPEKRNFFYPGRNKADFEVIVKNDGNVSEQINLEIRPDKKLTVETGGRPELLHSLTLPANSDTTLHFTASYSYDKKRVFDISRVQVIATGDEIELYNGIIIEKYTDTYAPLKINKNLPHSIEFGLRTFKQNDEILPFLNANGVSEYKNDASFRYSFTYHDLTETENIIGNSYYQFLYNRKQLNVGVGAFSSSLGRNLYSRNCLMFSNEIELTKTTKMKGYGSVGYVDPKTSAGLGYAYEKNDFKMETAIAYDMDILRKTNTGSFMHRFHEIKLHPKHSISSTIYSYYEQHNTENPYSQLGVAYDLLYTALLSERFTLSLANRYGSPDIPGSQMGLFSLNLLSKYYLSNNTNYFALHLNNSSKNYYIIDADGVRLPDVSLLDKYANLFYYSYTKPNFKWSFGPSVELYKSENPLIGLGKTKDFNMQKYRLEYRARLGKSFSFALKGGLSRESDDFASNQYSDKYDFHFLGEYNNSGYGVRISYDYGPMVNTGLYQYALDAGSNAVIVTPFVLKNYLGGLIGVTLFTNFTYRIDQEYKSLNVNPKVETYIINDYYFVVGGTYNYVQQVFNERTYSNSFYYLEFTIKKRWGKKGKNNRDREFKRMKVLMFQDDNGNGEKDPGEKGVPFVKTRILLKSTPDKEAREGLPVDITLLSNESGYSTFNKIPLGYYEIFIAPLSDLNEYFYVSHSIESVELIDNMVYEIPFQKARKITGQINIKRRKFIKEEEEGMDLKNIRVTAYNQEGHSYSAFTDAQGRFVMNAPGGLTYFVRIENIFGSTFKILQNDIKINLSDEILKPIIFNVSEANKAIKIKKSSSSKDLAQKKKIQKIKVLSGEVYGASNKKKRVDKNSTPDFEIDKLADGDHEMVVGKFYVIVGSETERTEALKILKIHREMGVNAFIGLNDYNGRYYIFTNFFDRRQDTSNEIRQLKNIKVKNADVFEMTTEP